MRILARAASFTILISIGLTLLAAGVHAQVVTPPSLTNVLERGSISAIVTQPDGKVIIAGRFERVGGIRRQNIARLFPSGKVDVQWAPEVDGGVHALALDNAGNVIIAGAFSTVNQQPRSGLAKISLDANGSLDPVWAPACGGLCSFTTLQVDGEGHVYVGGLFYQIGGLGRTNVAKLSLAGVGAVDPVWAPNPYGSPALRVASYVIALHVGKRDGYLYVGGVFTEIGGVQRRYLARVETTGRGAVDETWMPNADGAVSSFAEDNGGNIYLAGSFRTLGGVARSGLARVSNRSPFSVDSGWSVQLEGWASRIALDSLGNAYAAGPFTKINGEPRDAIAKVDAHGRVQEWNPQPSGWDIGIPLHMVSAIAVTGGRVHFGGEFRSVGGEPHAGLAAVEVTTANPDPSWPSVFLPGKVQTIAFDSVGRRIIAGSFVMVGDAWRRNIARLDASDVVDPLWNPVWQLGIGAIAIDSQSNVAVSGFGSERVVARLSGVDGRVDGVWAPASLDSVQSIAFDRQGYLYLAGSFDGGSRVLARMRTFGVLDREWVASTGSIRQGLAVTFDAEGNPYVGGQGGLAKVSSRNGELLWAIPSGGVNRIVSDGQGSLYVGGGLWDGLPVQPIAKVGANGVVDRSWVPQVGHPTAFTADTAGRLYVAFDRYELVRLLPSGSLDAAWRSDTDAYAHAIAVHADGNLHVGGEFRSIGGQEAFGYAVLGPDLSQPIALFSTTRIRFDEESMGASSPPQVVHLANTGGGTLLAQVAIDSPHFRSFSNCGPLRARMKCTINVVFSPLGMGVPLNSSIPVAATLSVGASAAQAGRGVSLTGIAEKSLVSHYYKSILGRVPDATGKAFWAGEASRMVSLGVDVNETWFAMAVGFYNSNEYLALGRNDTDHVRDLYRTFFNRDPDAEGRRYWTGQLASGMPREIALASFLFSGEFRSFTQAIFGRATPRAEVDTVVDFYRGLLGRLPDSAGLDFWVRRFRTAQCQGPAGVYAQVESISSAYANSLEYAARRRSNAQYVGDLYNAFLRRGGELQGVRYWIEQLDSGARSRDNVRRAFIASPEFSERMAGVVTQGCLQ